MDSPIPPEQRPSFDGLNYFPPESSYCVVARLDRFDHVKSAVIATSAGMSRSYLKYGKFAFEIEGTRLQLTVFKSAEDPFARSLFVPFSDATSGSETYGSGRYLDIEEKGGDVYELDFNMAYNPYCAHSSHYSCPMCPRENKLPIRILAGEKNYK